MALIQFSAKSKPPVISSPDEIDGVVTTRRLSHARSNASLSKEKHDVEANESFEEGELRRAGDVKTRQVFKGWNLFWLAYQSTGVIYGDVCCACMALSFVC
jgi:KUP system potassium uptake protein